MENVTLARKRILAVEEALPDMAEALNLAEAWIWRHDQEKELMKATQDVSNRVKSEQSQELFAYQLYLRTKVQENLVSLVVDVVKGVIDGRLQPHPYRASKTPCFRRVMVGVGPEGVPGDLRVVNVSQLTRDRAVSESAVEKTLLAQGLSLFTLQKFEELATWLGQEVLDGRLRLPYHPSESSHA